MSHSLQLRYLGEGGDDLTKASEEMITVLQGIRILQLI